MNLSDLQGKAGINSVSGDAISQESSQYYSVTFLPSNRKARVPDGMSVLQAAGSAGITIGALCGGEGICGRCRMIVRKGEVATEHFHKLSRQQIQEGYVLGCLSYIKSDAVIEIPADVHTEGAAPITIDSSRFGDHQSEALPINLKLSPLVQKVFLILDKPSLTSNMADHQRVCAQVRKKLDLTSTLAGLDVIRKLPSILRQADFKVTATVGIRGGNSEILDVEPGNTEKENYIAVADMGTTTVVVHLVDVARCHTVDSQACFNSQAIHGAEVTARLMAAERIGCRELQKLLVGDLNRLIGEIAKKNGIDVNKITAVVCAGNTVMSHFLLGLPIENIRRNPYIAASVEPSPMRAAEVGLAINPAGMLYSLAGISGWVGSDVTAGILAVGMHQREEICLLVDIGTNGEVAVGNREWLMACSASACPALEGASVECGMRAEAGAIERVSYVNESLTYKTIGNASPRGLCGSGIIDAIHVLLTAGIINRNGKIVKDIPGRIMEKEGVKGYILVPKGENGAVADIYITEADIANIINAKAAIYAAMKIMMRRLDLSFADIHSFMIAGAFGNYLDIESAVGIGLIPNIPRERVHFVGNTSIRGAKIAALHKDAYDQIIGIERSTTYYDLMGADDYVEEFSKAMFLPHTDIESY